MSAFNPSETSGVCGSSISRKPLSLSPFALSFLRETVSEEYLASRGVIGNFNRAQSEAAMNPETGRSPYHCWTSITRLIDLRPHSHSIALQSSLAFVLSISSNIFLFFVFDPSFFSSLYWILSTFFVGISNTVILARPCLPCLQLQGEQSHRREIWPAEGRQETKHVNVTQEAAKETRQRVVHHQPQLLIYPGRAVIYSTHPYSLSF